MSILDLSESEAKKIYAAIVLIESALKAHGELYFDSYLNDNEHDSVIHLSYSNTRQQKQQPCKKQ